MAEAPPSGKRQGMGYAVTAGLCAATAAVTAKLAFSSSELGDLCQKCLEYSSILHPASCFYITPFCQFLLFILTLTLNGFMWTLYIKAMQFCSTMQATITNTASNLLFTAILGWILFGESQSLRWFCGASLIVTGLLLMHRGMEGRDKKKH